MRGICGNRPSVEAGARRICSAGALRKGTKKPRPSDLESWGLLYLLPAAQDSRQACMAECVQGRAGTRRTAHKRFNVLGGINTHGNVKAAQNGLQRVIRHGVIVALRGMPAEARRMPRTRFSGVGGKRYAQGINTA